MTPWAVVVVLLAVVGAGAVQALTGFGFALFAVPIISLALSMRETVALAAILGLVSATGMSVRQHRDVDRTIALRMVIPSLLAMPFGLMAAETVSEDALRIALGVSAIVFSALLATGFRIHHSRPAIDVVAGLVSGVLATTIGTNGPPLAMVLQARGMAPHRFRATLSAIFTVAGVVTVALLWSRMTREVWLLTLGALPGMWIGWQIGHALSHKLDHGRFERLVRALLLVTATTVLIAALT